MAAIMADGDLEEGEIADEVLTLPQTKDAVSTGSQLIFITKKFVQLSRHCRMCEFAAPACKVRGYISVTFFAGPE